MATPIDNDEAVLDGKETAVDSVEESENIAGTSVSVTEAIGSKKSFIDQNIPTNTSLNPYRPYYIDPNTADPYYPTTVATPPNATRPKFYASMISDNFRSMLYKHWLADGSKLGLEFVN